jgi:hypothetical protein
MEADGGGWTLTYVIRNEISSPQHNFFPRLGDGGYANTGETDPITGGQLFPGHPDITGSWGVATSAGLTKEQRAAFWGSSAAGPPTEYRATNIWVACDGTEHCAQDSCRAASLTTTDSWTTCVSNCGNPAGWDTSSCETSMMRGSRRLRRTTGQIACILTSKLII